MGTEGEGIIRYGDGIFSFYGSEGEAYYPSKLMPWAYSENRKSPVDAIMDAAARLGMKVFMSIGWAKDQDDNLRDPVIQQRQLDMMKELASIYRTHKALYGWYLPVEDCLCPILSEHAVNMAWSILILMIRNMKGGCLG